MPVSKRTAEQDTDAIKPYWVSDCGRAVVYVGDCRKVMAQMESDQFHAVVTDPPYGLEFMGREWDAPWKQDGSTDARQRRAGELVDPIKAQYLRHNTTYGMSDPQRFQAWFHTCADGMLRIAKPGAHLLSFGGTRMWHRMTCGAEDAGWEVRDTIMWVYGSGFPKSHDVSKAIDKVMGAERGRIDFAQSDSWREKEGRSDRQATVPDDQPATTEAHQWQGYGTALKPSHEPIILARKPIPGTVAQCVLENGTGALNIDGCRIGVAGGCKRDEALPHVPRSCGNALSGSVDGSLTVERSPQVGGLGRWPANFIHDGSDEVTALFPQSSSSRQECTSQPGTVYGHGSGLPSHTGVYGFNDRGSASRFFYTAKADSSDRPHGKGVTTHPTVKPLDLMRYLVRLVCAPGGVVLDPFMGSGSTGCAAILEGMRFVGIEQSEEYADLAVGRLKLALAEKSIGDIAPMPGQVRVTKGESAPPPRRKMRGTE